MGMGELEKHAQQQFGVVSRAQAVEALGARSSIAWKLATGELAQLSPVAYRLRGTPQTWESKAMSALFIGGEGSALSHHTAAWLHRLDGFKEPGDIDVTCALRRGKRARPGLIFHRPTRAIETSVIASGLPITTAQRTIVDLAGVLENEPLELALDSANRRYPRFGDWLSDLIKTLNPQFTPGLAKLEALLELRRGLVTDSALEVKVVRTLRAHGLDHCVVQFNVFENGQFVMRIDFAWPEHKVALHADGFRWHQQRERFDRDARQRSRLQKLGWRFITVTKTTLDEGSWLGELRSLLDPQAGLAFS